jgi:hypothetical protein
MFVELADEEQDDAEVGEVDARLPLGEFEALDMGRDEIDHEYRAEQVAARQDDGVKTVNRCLFMPDELHGLLEHLAYHVISIMLAVAAWENQHSKFHDDSLRMRGSVRVP